MTLPREAWPRLKRRSRARGRWRWTHGPAYLAAVCNGDEALRHEVELLLAHGDQAASFLETPAMPFDDSLVAKSLEGQCIGPYQVSALIGTGGMGEVYSARDTRLNRDVALKVLPERFALDPDRAARFTREAHLLATLNHPNIAAIYGLEESNRTQALVLELVDGPTLSDRIARGPMSLAEALTIARQMAEALEAPHEKGIIHRDLKPANIKIADRGGQGARLRTGEGVGRRPTVRLRSVTEADRHRYWRADGNCSTFYVRAPGRQSGGSSSHPPVSRHSSPS